MPETKILVGIDYRNGYRDTLTQLERLKFDSADITLLHAMGSRVIDTATSNLVGELGGVFHGVLEREAASLLGTAHNLSQGRFNGVTTFLSRRNPVEALVEEAEAVEASIIALTPTVRSNSDRPYGATVAGVLDRLPCNLLLTRPQANDQVSTAVFAVDHSAYSLFGMQVLLNHIPRGVEKMHLLHVDTGIRKVAENTFESRYQLASAGANGNLEMNSTVPTKVKNLQMAFQEQLESAGIRCESTILQGDPKSEISRFADEKNAGLIIGCIRGETNEPEIPIGSVARCLLNQKSASVLLLRAS